MLILADRTSSLRLFTKGWCGMRLARLGSGGYVLPRSSVYRAAEDGVKSSRRWFQICRKVFSQLSSSRRAGAATGRHAAGHWAHFDDTSAEHAQVLGDLRLTHERCAISPTDRAVHAAVRRCVNGSVRPGAVYVCVHALNILKEYSCQEYNEQNGNWIDGRFPL